MCCGFYMCRAGLCSLCIEGVLRVQEQSSRVFPSCLAGLRAWLSVLLLGSAQHVIGTATREACLPVGHCNIVS
jgi:hypothetical protein